MNNEHMCFIVKQLLKGTRKFTQEKDLVSANIVMGTLAGNQIARNMSNRNTLKKQNLITFAKYCKSSISSIERWGGGVYFKS